MGKPNGKAVSGDWVCPECGTRFIVHPEDAVVCLWCEGGESDPFEPDPTPAEQEPPR